MLKDDFSLGDEVIDAVTILQFYPFADNEEYGDVSVVDYEPHIVPDGQYVGKFSNLLHSHAQGLTEDQKKEFWYDLRWMDEIEGFYVEDILGDYKITESGEISIKSFFGLFKGRIVKDGLDLIRYYEDVEFHEYFEFIAFDY